MANDELFDAVIVGAGGAGGVVAGVLAEAGLRVLVLERGRQLEIGDIRRDHVRNQRVPLHGHNAGPEVGHPRVIVWPHNGVKHIAQPWEPDYENNAAGLGGGTRVWGAQAWRFPADDFRMASRYGVPDGSSLADWPIGYDDLEPYYDRAEWEVGVAGDAEAMGDSWRRRRGYPMPAVPDNPSRFALTSGAEALGWRTFPVPLAINTVPYLGRPACGQCSYCVGFACPVDAKNGSQNTLLPRALATGGCTIVTQAMAERIETDAAGRATGVSYFVDGVDGVERRRARARMVVVSAGAIESARLLLSSSSSLHPNGLGNGHDLVGRNLFGHVYTGAFGVFDDVVQDNYGPGVSIATTQFSHGNPGIIGGGMLANEFTKLPIGFWKAVRPPGLSRWGLANKQFMREAYLRTIHINGPIHDIPSPESRVQVDPNVRDKYGIPVARISGGMHPESLKTAGFLRARAEDWLRASGAATVWSHPNGYGRSAGQHQAGTCRMGVDRRESVTDTYGRIHDSDNVYVVDGSVHVTAGGFNPALTIMALAFRSAERIVSELK